MALTHHFIVNRICNVDLDSYALVGDDLVITSKDGFDRYIKFMTKIGMTVNLSKTIISEKQPHNVEFASNFYIDGNFIYPLNFGTLYA